MDTHKNARLTPKGREEMVRAVVEGGLGKAAVARRFNTTPKTVAKWVGRFRQHGVEGLHDRSSRPLSSPDQTPQATCDAVEVLRRQRYTGAQIAGQLAISPATVSRIQWLMLQVLRLPKGLQAPATAPHPHQALYAQDQRQGRALHPDQLARMGLRAGLRKLAPAKRPATDLATSIQLAWAARRHRC